MNEDSIESEKVKKEVLLRRKDLFLRDIVGESIFLTHTVKLRELHFGTDLLSTWSLLNLLQGIFATPFNGFMVILDG